MDESQQNDPFAPIISESQEQLIRLAMEWSNIHHIIFVRSSEPWDRPEARTPAEFAHWLALISNAFLAGTQESEEPEE